MAVAYWWIHGRRAFLPIANGGELAVLYCFVFLLLWAHGGGEFSIDGWLHGRRKRETTAS
jgi:putative oxidoreductase